MDALAELFGEGFLKYVSRYRDDLEHCVKLGLLNKVLTMDVSYPVAWITGGRHHQCPFLTHYAFESGAPVRILLWFFVKLFQKTVRHNLPLAILLLCSALEYCNRLCEYHPEIWKGVHEVARVRVLDAAITVDALVTQDPDMDPVWVSGVKGVCQRYKEYSCPRMMPHKNRGKGI